MIVIFTVLSAEAFSKNSGESSGEELRSNRNEDKVFLWIVPSNMIDRQALLISCDIDLESVCVDPTQLSDTKISVGNLQSALGMYSKEAIDVVSLKVKFTII